MTNQKCDFFKSIKQRLKWTSALKIIFYLLKSPKFHFGEVEKAIYQVFARHWELIFFLLTNPKCEIGEVEKAMFQGVA